FHVPCLFTDRSSLFAVRRPRRAPPFPYTTLFRSARRPAHGARTARGGSTGVPAPFASTQPRDQQLTGPHCLAGRHAAAHPAGGRDRKSTRLNSSHVKISYAVFCVKKKNTNKKLNS